MYNFYTSLGRTIEKSANHKAHLVGLGPIALTNRVEKLFGDSPAVRQQKLDNLFYILNSAGDISTQEVGIDFKKLIKECKKLMQKYALP